MSCPYFKEGHFGICVAPDAIHVPSIDEMERFCFRSWYSTCPNIAFRMDPQKEKTLQEIAGQCLHAERIETGRSHG